MVASVYIPRGTGQDSVELRARLKKIRAAWEELQARRSEDVELIIWGDFNRHDQFWGVDHAIENQR